MDYRSPLENIFNIIGGLPQGHDKPVKHAVYNAIALFVLFVCCAALWALYLILEPFIKPLLWALLVGSVLHPFKRSLALRFKSWFDTLDESNTPVFIGVFLIPVNVVNDLSDVIGAAFMKYWKILTIGLGTIGLAHLAYFYTPTVLINLVIHSWNFSNLIFNFFINCSSTLMIVSILLMYSSLLAVRWNPENNNLFHYASMILWFLISCFVANQFGAFQIPIFIFLLLTCVVGFIFEVLSLHNEFDDYTWIDCFIFALQGKDLNDLKSVDANEVDKKNNEKEKSVATKQETPELTPSDTKKDPWSLDLFETNKMQTNPSLLITDQGNVHIIKPPPADIPSPLSIPKVRRSQSQPFVGNLSFRSRLGLLNWRRKASLNAKAANGEVGSQFYIYSILWGCGAIIFWRNMLFVPILCIPIIIYLIKKSGHYLGVWGSVKCYWDSFTKAVQTWCIERYDALVPVPIRGFFKIVYKTNVLLKQYVKESIDTVATCIVIFSLILFVLFASIFIFVQVYGEAIMLVQMTSNVINQTVVHNPELRQLLPPSFDSALDSVLDNAYQYGREGISKAVKGMMNGVDPTKSEKLENQVLELFDRIYQTWMSSDGSHGPKVTSDAVEVSWNNFIEHLQKSPEVLNFSGLVSFINQNVGTLMSLLDSIWSIVKGNISLILSSFSAIISVVLGGGTAVFNFILSLIIFLTTLFYLLSSSGELYKPVEIMTKFSTNGNRLGLALGDAINGVFTASFKMAIFYGLWTWFIHNLFSVKIVYLPSALASTFAAAPFIAPYWACTPAFFDLWLAQDKGIYAIIFALVQLVPPSFVDATIYSEIKGGHPYLTGLAIAGGIFCLGLAGAIIGPLILCGLYVLMDLSTTLFKDTPSEEAISLQHLSR